MQITLQYFDGCPNWETTAERLAVIKADRKDFTVIEQRVETQADAEALDFRGSPTLLIDGTPLFPAPDAPPGLACRVYLTPDGVAGSPSMEKLHEAISSFQSTDH